MGTRYWFRPKSFGYGATPITWQGWALTLGSMILLNVAILAAVLAEVQRWPDRRFYQAICALVAAVTLLGSILLSRLKTEGDWRWRS